MAAKPDREPRDPSFDDPSDRVTLLADTVDHHGHLGIPLGVQRVDGAGVTDAAKLRERAFSATKLKVAERHNPARNIDAKHGQQLPGEGTSGDASCRFAGACPFEHASHAAEVLDRAGEIRVPRPRAIDILKPLQLGIAVDHFKCQRATEGHPPPEP